MDNEEYDIYGDLDDLPITSCDFNLTKLENESNNNCEFKKRKFKTFECESVKHKFIKVEENQNNQNSQNSINSKPNYTDQLDHPHNNNLESLNEIINLENRLVDLNKKLIKVESEKEASFKDNQELNRKIAILKTNISSLYKTARSEIDRKNQQIKSLQEQLDTIKFRRNKYKPSTESKNQDSRNNNNKDKDYRDRRSNYHGSRKR